MCVFIVSDSNYSLTSARRGAPVKYRKKLPRCPCWLASYTPHAHYRSIHNASGSSASSSAYGQSRSTPSRTRSSRTHLQLSRSRAHMESIRKRASYELLQMHALCQHRRCFGLVVVGADVVPQIHAALIACTRVALPFLGRSGRKGAD